MHNQNVFADNPSAPRHGSQAGKTLSRTFPSLLSIWRAEIQCSSGRGVRLTPEAWSSTMMNAMTPSLVLSAAFVLSFCARLCAQPDESNSRMPTQLPRAMHVPMTDRPMLKVGKDTGDLRGADLRALLAAVDYVAALGGGTVEIGPGTYIMRDSLHLRPGVTVQGTPGQTILRKADAATSPLKLDGDYGEEQITLENVTGFEVGDGVAVWDKNAGGFHTTVARVTGRRDRTISISGPLNADCMVDNGAQAATVFPLISGYYADGVVLKDLIVDGNKTRNPHLNGCRGGGIFLYRCHGARIERCNVRDYNGDGLSFQQSNDVKVMDCVAEENSSLGFHPGSGSQRPLLRHNRASRNGEDGLFLCWRVQEGIFEENTLEQNGRFGISIGHKDSDNLVRSNVVRSNCNDGIFFRNEREGMAAHRNRIEENIISDNGRETPASGIRVRGQTKDLVIRSNSITDSRLGAARQQVTGIALESEVGGVVLENNIIDASEKVRDQRAGKVHAP
jgi:nitrous oxidase accessory protein NosD